MFLSALLCSAFLFAGTPGASAAVGPGFEPDIQTKGACGDPGTASTFCTLHLYDANGVPKTSGLITDAPFADWIQADQLDARVGDTKAFIVFANPITNATDGSGFVQGPPQNVPSPYPNPNAPAALNKATATTIAGSGFPLVAYPAAASQTIAKYLSTHPLTSTSDPGVLQIRLFTAAPNAAGTNYYSADIHIDAASGAWTLVYPTALATTVASTSVALTVTPTSAGLGASVTLQATVSPVTATGSVQFVDGTANLGTPVVTSGGGASLSTTAASAPAGVHNLTAKFIPSDTTAFAASASQPVSLTITSAVAANITLSVTPPGSATSGSLVTLTARVTPPAATGSVQFVDGTTNLGEAVPLNTGTAVRAGTTLQDGTHSLVAVFKPADPSAFASVTSSAVAYVVGAQGTTPTVTSTVTTTVTLAASPVSPAPSGTAVTLTASLSPAAAVGRVQFMDGSSNLLNPVAVTTGTAAVVTTFPPGTHTLTANFTPTDATAYTTATVSVSYTVTSGPSVTATDSVGHVLQPGSTLVPGVTLTLAGSAFTPSETVTVTVQSAPVVLASGKLVSSAGSVTATVALPTNLLAGSHTLTVTGTMGDSAAFPFQIAGFTAATTPTGTVSGALGSSNPAATTARHPELPVTGFDHTNLAVLGGLLILSGGFILLIPRPGRHSGRWKSGS